MRKAAALLLVLFMSSGVSAASVNAVIDPGNPDDIVLDSGNSYEKVKPFDGSKSSGPGSLSYTWNWEEQGNTTSGINVDFRFNQDSSQTNTIKLTVSNGSDTDTAEVTQVLRDRPEFTTTPSDTTVDLDTSTTSKKLKYEADTGDNDFQTSDTFDASLSYSWDLDDANDSHVTTGNDQSFTHTFDKVTADDADDDYDLNLTVTDSAGYSQSYTVGIDVDNTTSSSSSDSSSSSSSSQSSNSGSGAGGGQQQQQSFDIVKDVIISAGQSQEYSIPEGPVTAITINAGDQVVVGGVKLNNVDSRPSEASEDPSGKVYEYVEIVKENFDNSQVSSVKFKFEVEKSWMEDNDVAPETVALQRYDGGWEELDTSQSGEESGSYQYTATSNGFSAFAVTGEGFGSLVNVTGVELNATSVKKGKAVAINVTVENTASSSTDYELEVDAGGKTLKKTLEDFGPGETRSVTFEASFGSTGSQTVSVGDQEVKVEVGGGGGIPWMLIGGVILLVLLAIVGFLFYPEIKAALGSIAGGGGSLDEAESLVEAVVLLPLVLLEKAENLLSHVKGLLSGDGGTGYSFEGFGDEEFEYSFEDRN